jgi:hypothetical protein
MGINNMRRDLVPNAYPPKARSDRAELSFFNVMMAATYFRRAARTRHPNVVRDIGRVGTGTAARRCLALRY